MSIQKSPVSITAMYLLERALDRLERPMCTQERRQAYRRLTRCNYVLCMSIQKSPVPITAICLLERALDRLERPMCTQNNSVTSRR